jgi:hypothetical protein
MSLNPIKHFKMNKILLFFCIAILFLNISCNSSKHKEADIIGNWKIENIELDQPLKPNEKPNFDLFLSQIRESAYFNFKNDHSYESFFNEMSKGTWNLSNKGKDLVTKPDDADADTVQIEKLNGTTFIIISESEGVKTKITMKKEK